MVPVLPIVIISLGSISGFGGLLLSAKSAAYCANTSDTNRIARERSEKKLLYFQACTQQLTEALNRLGSTRMTIEKNFTVFVQSFEKIHNRHELLSLENSGLPKFDFNEIKNVSAAAKNLIEGVLYPLEDSASDAAAACGITAAVMALSSASTGVKVLKSSKASSVKAALEALGQYSVSAGGGNVALGMAVLNAAFAGPQTVFERLAMSFAGSTPVKKKDEIRTSDIDKKLSSAADLQLSLTGSADRMRSASSRICNGIYKKRVLQLKKLTEQKTDWDLYTDDEIQSVKNCIQTVQILHHLNNIPLYKVLKINNKNQITQIDDNYEEVKTVITGSIESLSKKS